MTDDEDYATIIEEASDASGSLAAARANDNPEQALRSKRLADASGVPPMVVHADPKGFEQRYKANMASYLVRNSPELQDFIRSHPLTGSIANDDWGNLDDMVKRSRQTAEVWNNLQGPEDNWLKSPWMTGEYGDTPGGLSPVQEGFAAPWRQPLTRLEEVFPGMTRPSPLGQAALTAGELALRGGMSAWNAGLAAIAQTNKMLYTDAMEGTRLVGGEAAAKGLSNILTGGVGGDVSMDAERFGRTMAAIAEMKMMQDSGKLPEWVERNRLIKDIKAFEQAPAAVKEGLTPEQQHYFQTPEGAGVFNRVTRSYENVKQWLDNDLTPPRGVDELWDQVHATRNAAGVKALNDDLQTAYQSAVRERDPNLFSKLLEPQYGNSSFGISIDYINQLYGTREPAPGDGLLGWIPDLADKLKVARDTGDDVMVRIRDWVAHVDPKIAQDAMPFLRTVPEGITQAEATVPKEYKPVLDSPMAAARDEMASQPMFSIGDRKLILSRRELKPVEPPTIEGRFADVDPFALEEEAAAPVPRGWERAEAGPVEPTPEAILGKEHHFDLLDHKGNVVGRLNLSEHRDRGLWVNIIEGVNGFGVRDFGPSLIRDLKRQIRAELPQFIGQEIGGWRVSGGRKLAGKADRSAWVKLSADDLASDKTFRDILEGGEWQSFHPQVEGYMRAKQTPEVQAILDSVRQEFHKIVGEHGLIDFPEAIDQKGVPYTVEGVAWGYSDLSLRNIVLAAVGEDTRGIMRHEAIHVLRRRGLISDAEWAVLSKFVEDGGWIEKLGIDKDYAHLDREGQIEEAVGDLYRGTEAFKDEHVKTLMDRIKDFFHRIRQAVDRALGRPGTLDDIFDRISAGEMAGREVRPGPGEYVSKPTEPKLSIGPDEPPYVGVLRKIRADALGIRADTLQRIHEELAKRFSEDVTAAEKRIAKEKQEQATATYKSTQAAVRKEVEATIRARPDVAADLYFSAGDLHGVKKGTPIRIASDSLSEAQKEALPRNYYGKEGLPVDTWGTYFGFTSGDAMVQALAQLHGDRTVLKESAIERTGRLVREETTRRMEKEYGDPTDTLMAQARERALSETDFNLLTQEYYAAASVAKQPIAIDKLMATEIAKEALGKLPIRDISVARLRNRMQQSGDAAFNAWANGDVVGAVQHKQQQVLAGAYVREAAALEIMRPKFDKMMAELRRKEQKSLDPQYRNLIHMWQQRLGIPVSRLPENIKEDIDARLGPGQTVADFIIHENAMGRINKVPDFMLLDGFKSDVDDLTMAQFKAVNDAFVSLRHNGRESLKLKVGNEAFDRDFYVQDIVNNIRDLFHGKGAPPIPEKGVMGYIRTHFAGLIQLESLFNRLDHYAPMGPLQQVLRGVIESSNREELEAKRYAKIFREEIGRLPDLDKAVDNPLGIGDVAAMRDGVDGPWPLTRAHVLAMVLNASTNKRYFKNWGVDPDAAMQWLMTVTTKADWDWAQKIWTKIWEDTKVRSGNMYRGMTGGLTPEWLIPAPVETPWGVYSGYYPVLLHKEILGKSTKATGDISGILDDHYYQMTAAPPAPHTIERVGTDRPLSLDLNDMGLRLRQVIHDTEMRPALVEAGKIFFDPRIQNAFRMYVGPEYAALLKPYLRDVANAPNYRSEWEHAAWRASEFLRQNAVFTVVGLNPNTFLKHTPTALIQSINEIGSTWFADAVRDTWHIPGSGGETWDWAMNTFNELGRRMRNYEEALYGQVQELSLTPRSRYMSMRDFVMKYSSYPVAYGDLWSAVPTAVGAYRRALSEGMSEEKAIEMGNRAVRMAHGSASMTNRPAIMRAGPAVQWLTSIYSFYSHMLQKALTIKWRIQDRQTFMQMGDAQKAKETMNMQMFAGMTWAYALGPAVVGTLVAAANGEWKHDEDAGEVFSKQLLHHTAGYFPIVRDFVSAGVHGLRDPQLGLTGTAAQLASAPIRDLFKTDPFSEQHAGKFMQDMAGAFGMAGLVPLQVGKWARAIHDVHTGEAEQDFLPQFMRGHERLTKTE